MKNATRTDFCRKMYLCRNNYKVSDYGIVTVKKQGIYSMEL